MATPLRLLEPPLAICPRCQAELADPHPASRYDGREEGTCSVHGRQVADYGWPVPLAYPVGATVEVEFADGWVPGVVEGHRADLTEDLVRIDVRLGPDRLVAGTHPKHVRPDERAARADRTARLNALHTGTYRAGE